MVKYPLWIGLLILLYYTIQHEGGGHIDFRQMSMSPRQTTANNCKTAFSLHVVESASDGCSVSLCIFQQPTLTPSSVLFVHCVFQQCALLLIPTLVRKKIRGYRTNGAAEASYDRARSLGA